MAEPQAPDEFSAEDFAELNGFLQDASGPAPQSEEALEVAAAPVSEVPALGGLVGEQDAEVEVTMPPGMDHYAVETWEELALSEELMDGILLHGYPMPSKIQAWTMPISLKGHNIIAQALNGSGKTAAFALGMLAKVKPGDKWCQGICLCHTRELASQNHEVIKSLGQKCGLDYELLVAGTKPAEVNAYAQIVTATPGKLNDLRRRTIDISWATMFVIDEADHMIDQDQNGKAVVEIRDAMPKDIQILLFSATWPEEVQAFAKRMVPNATEIMVKKEDLTLTDIKQYWMDTPEDQKMQALKNIYGSMALNQSIIFVNTRWKALKVAKAMQAEKFSVSLICGTQSEGREKMELWQRDKIMKEFRTGVSKVLVATDILARGIDVPAVTIVVNYDLPVKQQWDRGAPRLPDTETYLHRIGRTGRFGLKGVAVNFVPPADMQLLQGVKDHYKCDVHQLAGEPEEMEEIMKQAHGRF